MKPISLSSVITFVCSLFFTLTSLGQSFGTSSSAVWLTTCSQNNYFNTSGSGPGLIGPAGNVFNNANLGVHTRNAGTLILRGGEVRTFKTPGIANVCSVRMYYRVYPTAGVPGSFNTIDLPFVDDCNIPTSAFPSGGSCAAGDQKWNRVIANGETVPYAPVNLTSLAAGNYTLEVYYDVTGSSTSTTLCDETVVLNNSGNNYKATFSIQIPDLESSNPTTCNGNQGVITITGLVPGVSYAVSYSDDGVPVGPNNYVANAAGHIDITGLNAGIYADFDLTTNGCSTELNTGLILSNPVFVPTFPAIPSFCAGTTPPTLPTTSTNGLTGTWSPSVVDNQNSGTYTFTPTGGQCGITIVRNITVIQRTTPTFTFGTSLSICSGGAVPALPGTSTNGITGTWSPAVVSNTSSGTYTFTPTAGQCANPTTFTVTVTPNIAPTFSFGNTLTICAGAGVPALPTTSNNGITGTWSPAVVDNQNSATYTFTPSGAQCATTANFSVTVNPNATPTFSFGPSLNICAGGSVPALPTTSNNGINGTWSPAIVDNQNSATYTFTPSGGVCALPVTFNVSVAPNIVPTFSFGTSMTICAGGAVPSLPATSDNGITGTWGPAAVDNQNSGTYTFTPAAGQCATAATFTLTVNPNIAPTFSFGSSLTICAGAAVPALPTTSNNGIAGTWSPAIVDNNTSGTYTFTPAAGVCSIPFTFTVTVNPNVVPVFSFTPSLTICAGGSVPSLPGTSDNGVSGTWSPAVVDNQASGTYTFTPGAACTAPVTFTVTVNPNLTPSFTFGSSLTICAGGTVPTLPATSTNGINGAWSPAVVDNLNSGTYTFTPSAGQCAVVTSFTVTVNPIVTPTFSFGAAFSICSGSNAPALPGTSTNGITGTWSPAVIDNQNSGSYTFTPAAGQCANTTTLNVTVNPTLTPSFSIGNSLTICAGAAVPSLPATSDNGIAGTWSPAIVDNNASGTYTFTASGGVCANTFVYNVTVNPNLTPTFSFGTSQTICEGSTAPVLPATSTNGITGTWSPATVDNQVSAVYTFTPNAGQCAVSTTFTVTVSANVIPTFSFGTTLTICAGDGVPALPTTSDNGISGTWSPAVVDRQASAVYTFTPSAGQCATTTAYTVTVNPNTTPTFSFGTSLTICIGGTVPTLPNTSDNGVSGSWSPAVVDNQASGVYTFTPTVMPGQCILSTTYTVTVNPIVTPTFSFGSSLSICAGKTVPVLPTTSSNGITGTWSPSVIDNQNSATYTFTTTAGQCAAPTATLNVTVNPVGTVNSVGLDTTVTDGTVLPSNILSGTPAGVTFNWTNNNTSIGLGASGAGNVPSFTATNNGATPISGTITVTPTMNGCAGIARSYVVTVKPLIKDIFVPNVFSPNGDGKNDLLLVYGNYISKLEMRIFNQWGEQVEMITDPAKGWNGRHKGQPQPVGVYVYVLKAVMADGRTINLKGYITLVR